MAAKKNTRVCSCCKRAKSTSEFYRRADAPHRFRSHCIQCMEKRIDKDARIARARRWRLVNPGANSAACKSWRSRNPGYERLRWAKDTPRLKARGRVSYQKHRGIRIASQARRDRLRWSEIQKYRRDWWKRNPDRAAQYRNSRRAAKCGNGGAHTAADIQALYVTQGGRCLYCGRALKKYHVDHKTPLSRGGSNGPENLALACIRCNLKKRTRTETEFRALLAT